jgi:hypothetical protein
MQQMSLSQGAGKRLVNAAEFILAQYATADLFSKTSGPLATNLSICPGFASAFAAIRPLLRA